MRRFAAALLAVLMTVGLCGCSWQTESPDEAREVIQVIAMDTVMIFTTYGEKSTHADYLSEDEVRRLDNKNAIVLIRGEKPVLDEKYDILKHPNIHRTEDGGAPPYLHTPLRAFAADDLSFPIENIDDIEILEESI